MFEGVRRRVGLSYSQMHFRHNRDRIMNFTEALSRSRRALVIFPDSPPDGESVSTIVRYFLRKFSAEGMMVLIRDDQLFSMASAPPLKTLTYSAQDVNSWFLPSKALRRKIEKKSFDIAVDLNFHLSLTSAFLCKASQAPVRVSFAKQNGGHFYNFEFQSKGTSGDAHSYKSFLKCLDMF